MAHAHGPWPGTRVAGGEAGERECAKCAEGRAGRHRSALATAKARARAATQLAWHTPMAGHARDGRVTRACKVRRRPGRPASVGTSHGQGTGTGHVTTHTPPDRHTHTHGDEGAAARGRAPRGTRGTGDGQGFPSWRPLRNSGTPARGGRGSLHPSRPGQRLRSHDLPRSAQGGELEGQLAELVQQAVADEDEIEQEEEGADELGQGEFAEDGGEVHRKECREKEDG